MIGLPFFCIKVKCKRTLAFFLIICLISIISFELLNCFSSEDKIIGDEECVDFLNELGYNANRLLYEKDIFIPEKFGEVFENYNRLQIISGYNLKKYSGKTAKLFCYKISDAQGLETEYNANIIVYENTIIGGDISSVSIDGKMMPLKKKGK